MFFLRLVERGGVEQVVKANPKVFFLFERGQQSVVGL
jgi:hypothetical protein